MRWIILLIVAASVLGCDMPYHPTPKPRRHRQVPPFDSGLRGDGSGGKGIPYTDQISIRPGDE